MSKKVLYFALTMVLMLSFLVSCAPKATEAPAAEEPAAEEPAAEEPAAEEPAMEEEGWVCDYDQQTCDYLEGKDFSGQTLVVGVWGGTIEEIVRTWVIPPLEAHGGTVELLPVWGKSPLPAQAVKVRSQVQCRRRRKGNKLCE